MNDTWRLHKRNIFIRDIIRDYCRVHIVLNEQAQRFEHSGTISYAVLNELLGDFMRKGVLWRLKDAAHHIFRTHTSSTEPVDTRLSAEATQHNLLSDMLDWCVGYAFHECVKLKEDAFQRQHYTNRLLQLQNNKNQYADILEVLMPLTEQTHESLSREIQRILGVLIHVRDLLVLFLASHKDSGQVARFLVEDEALVQSSFGKKFDELLAALYGDNTNQRYLLALSLTLDNGHTQKAQNIISKAKENNVEAEIINEMQNLVAEKMDKVS